MKKVVHLSSVHRADDVRVFYKECRSLANAGFDVTLIARSDADMEQDGVAIRAVGSHKHGRLSRMTRTAMDVFRKARHENADLYHFHDPELIPVGVALRLLGKRVVFDAHENVAQQIALKHWIPGPVRQPVARAYRVVEWSAAQIMSGIVAATPSIARQFPSDKSCVVQNFPMESELPVQGTGAYHERGFNIAYVGGLTAERGAKELIDALAIANRTRPVRLQLAGSIKPDSLLKQLQTSEGWQYVDYFGWQDRQAVIALLSRARIGAVTFLPAGNHVESQPNKLFEYMLAGIPVIASDFDHWNQFVSEIGSGLMVDPRDSDSIARAILWLLDHPQEAEEMGQKGKKAVLKQYTWEREAERLVDFYNSNILH